MIDTLYDCAKLQYECGNYHGAAEYLYFYRILVPTTDRVNFIQQLLLDLALEILPPLSFVPCLTPELLEWSLGQVGI